MQEAPHYVEIDGHRLAYHRSGSGETVLLVHGITTYSFIWEPVLPFLVGDFDVISIDLLGCGDSDMPLDTSYAIQDHAERIHKFLKALGVEKVHYFGHDLGGGIGQILAVRHPEMLYDLTVANTVAYDFWPVQPITSMRTPIVRQLMMASFDLGTFKLVIRRGVFHTERVTEELMAKYMAPLKTREGRKAFLHFAHCLDNHNLTDIAEELRHLQVPLLIIRGDADPYLSPAIAEKLHEEVPGSRLVHVESASHFIQIDEPQRLAEEFRAFVEANNAG